ncbi:MAG: hypothetical protein ABI374_04980, partial [Ginsengibacter sp.]
MKKSVFFSSLFGLILISCHEMKKEINNVINTHSLYRSNEFAVFNDSVVQGPFVAIALSRSEIISNYKSPEDQSKSPEIKFKFSINGADNSAAVGKDNIIICAGGNGNYETPVIKFGKQYTDATKVSSKDYLQKDVKLTLR